MKLSYVQFQAPGIRIPMMSPEHSEWRTSFTSKLDNVDISVAEGGIVVVDKDGCGPRVWIPCMPGMWGVVIPEEHTCETCGQVFSRASGLATHTKFVHNAKKGSTGK